MKKSIAMALGVLSFCLCGCAVSGGASSATSHSHVYDTDSWEMDASFHWHPTLCAHTDAVNLEPHKLEQNIRVYENKHGYGDQEIRCSVCGYLKSGNYGIDLATVFTHEDKYSYDEIGHWQACTQKGYEDVLLHYERHYFADGKTCSTCGYLNKNNLNFTNKWTYDEEQHWHACMDQGYEAYKKDEADHTFVDTYGKDGKTVTHTCSVCRYSYTEKRLPELKSEELSSSFIIHYYRPSGKYAGWGLSFWKKDGSDSKYYEYAYDDGRGVVFAVPLSDFEVNAKTDSFGFLFYDAGWNVDIRDGFTVKLSEFQADKNGNYEFYLYSGQETVFTKQPYKVTWENYNGNSLGESFVMEGETPVYEGVTPKKSHSDSAKQYAFDGWSPDLEPIHEEQTYIAKFKEETARFTITWKNYDGTVLEVDENVLYGTTPNYDGQTPVGLNDEHHESTFKGWSPTVVAATENATYVADYDVVTEEFEITWLGYDDEVLYVSKAPYGNVPSYNYFTPTQPSTDTYDYEFVGWNPELTEVTGDASYKAMFRSKEIIYDIQFVNYDGTVLQKGEYRPGQTPSYSGTTPTKPASGDDTYKFTGWSPAIGEAHSDQVYTAQYKTLTPLGRTLDTIGEKWTTATGTYSGLSETIYFGWDYAYSFSLYLGNTTYYSASNIVDQYISVILRFDPEDPTSMKVEYKYSYVKGYEVNNMYVVDTEVEVTGVGYIDGSYAYGDGVALTLSKKAVRTSAPTDSDQLNKAKNYLQRLLSRLKSTLPSKCGVTLKDLGFVNY